MTDTPERIWAFTPDIFDNMSLWQDAPSPKGDTIEYIRADLVPQWRPIETAPKDGRDLLVLGPSRDGSGQYQTVCPFYRDRWTVEWMDNCLPPTHWMPLPEPPA